MLAQNSKRLRTQLQIALKRASVIARTERAEARRAEWSARLDVASYSCRREGNLWIAEGPAGQRFEFSRGATYSPGHFVVNVLSHTGGRYEINVNHGMFACSCPTPIEKREDAGCKHEVAYSACKQAHRMERQLTEEVLREEGAEMVAAESVEDYLTTHAPELGREYTPEG